MAGSVVKKLICDAEGCDVEAPCDDLAISWEAPAKWSVVDMFFEEPVTQRTRAKTGSVAMVIGGEQVTAHMTEGADDEGPMKQRFRMRAFFCPKHKMPKLKLEALESQRQQLGLVRSA